MRAAVASGPAGTCRSPGQHLALGWTGFVPPGERLLGGGRRVAAAGERLALGCGWGWLGGRAGERLDGPAGQRLPRGGTRFAAAGKGLRTSGKLVSFVRRRATARLRRVLAACALLALPRLLTAG